MNRTNTDFIFECNADIREYDIKSCNTSISREFDLVDTSLLDLLDSLDKEDREIRFGKLRGKNHELSKLHTEKVNEVVTEFIKINQLTVEDIISIKNDAVFVCNKDVHTTTIGKYVDFKNKNRYHAYLYLKPFEFYFHIDGTIDVKNLTKNKEIIDLHKNGILAILTEVVDLAESTGRDLKALNQYFYDLITSYKNRELSFDCYREFNQFSKFRMYTEFEDEILYDDISEDILQDVNISYNYINIILPLFRIICMG